MKMTSFVAALALAGAVAPPKISLDLEGMTSSYRLDKPIYRNGAEGQVSRQDWTEKCPALRFCPEDKLTADGTSQCESDESAWIYTSEQNCPFPHAKAFDHAQDSEVAVQTRIYLIDQDGQDMGEKRVNQVSFAKRATYLFKYDAKDRHGNRAEQVVFALILDDVEKPFFNNACKNDKAYQNGKWVSHIEVEAVSDWQLCEVAAYDNYDGDLDSEITYQIHHDSSDELSSHSAGWRKGFTQNGKRFGEEGFEKTMEKFEKQWLKYKDAAAFFKDGPNGEGPVHVGNFLVTTKVSDKAGVYGHDALNNVALRTQHIKVADKKAPSISLGGSDPSFVECTKFDMPENIEGSKYESIAWKGDESTCVDQLDTDALGQYLPVTTTTPLNKAVTGDDQYATGKVVTYNKDIADEVRTLPDVPRTSRVFKYECHDYAGNAAAIRTRTVTTVDTTAPEITLTNKGVETPGETVVETYEAHTSSSQKTDLSAYSYIATDSCDSSVTKADVKTSWGPRPFNPNQVGSYVRTYTVVDASGNQDRKTRTFNVIDQAIPMVKRVEFSPGAEALITIEASRSKSYSDKGATCNDFVDGELSHAVEVSGEVVNRRVPGTYVIRYDCQDLSGNNAVPDYRTVVVEDSQKPSIKLVGTEVVYVESGFPYVDAGATATDSLDGDLTEFIWTFGNTVNVGKYEQTSKSCQQINDKLCKDGKCESMPTSGKYYITYESGKRIAVQCFFFAEKPFSQVLGFTYHVHKNPSGGDCSKYGMKKFKWFNKKNPEYKYVKAHLLEMYPSFSPGNLDQYVCYQNNAKFHTINRKATFATSNPKIRPLGGSAIAGRYNINYYVEDAAGNHATVVTRTVVVKDTLPPVITLHLKNKLVHNGGVDVNTNIPTAFGANHKKLGSLTKNQITRTRRSWKPVAGAIPSVSGRKTIKRDPDNFPNQRNPAAYMVNDPRYTNEPGYKGFGNPNIKNYDYFNSLMAESVTSNGWIIGAVASAVAGVALLSYSARKSVTSVPV